MSLASTSYYVSPTPRPASVWRPELVDFARDQIGKKWRHQGRGPKYFDCAGLVIASAKHAGVMDPDWDFKAYAREPDGVTLLSLCERVARRSHLTKYQLGDFVVMRDVGLDVRWPCHMGILFEGRDGSPWIVHAYARQPIVRVVENPFSGEWVNQMIGVFTFEEAA